VTALLSNGWLWLAVGYLLGSIPFGLVLTRAAGLGDLRNIGSGNIGTTNVLRTGSKKLAAATLLLDAGKGAAAVLLAGAFSSPDAAALAGLGAFLGHLYPVWLRFAGGKGVATMLGIAAAYFWPSGLVFALVWIGAALSSRISSVGGMSAAVAAPLAALALGRTDAALLLGGMALLVLGKHRANLQRLRAGTEPRMGSGKGGDTTNG
jgi:glycerol-3-phosphate acyltransferase PlsY